MLRSFHYAAHTARRGQLQSSLLLHATIPIEYGADYWSAWVSATFLRTYLDEVNTRRIVPQDCLQLDSLIRAFVLEKALDELRFELHHRPDWATIPLQTIRKNCGTDQH
jgi:maltose alpha-D-glucosyltransferase/alpha-amylase